jgi:hypothetical protein
MAAGSARALAKAQGRNKKERQGALLCVLELRTCAFSGAFLCARTTDARAIGKGESSVLASPAPRSGERGYGAKNVTLSAANGVFRGVACSGKRPDYFSSSRSRPGCCSSGRSRCSRP